MRPGDLINRKYIVYGLSIVMSRGLELAVMFFAAHYLAKAVYGELEYYKKVLELGGVFLSFGFPSLILTYTRSRNSKVYILLFATIFIIGLSLIIWPILYLFKWTHLWLSLLFYALFFTGGVYQLYILVSKGSDFTALYKIIISTLFYSGVILYIRYGSNPSYAFIYSSRWLMMLGSIFLFHEWVKHKVDLYFALKYFKHFLKLISGTITLLLSNFTNLMFLYTDIFVIKLISHRPMTEIADYSFSLNVANILMLIPFTLIQTDIEKLKRNKAYFSILEKKIIILVIMAIIILLPGYWLMINKFYLRYSTTFLLFVLILIAKLFQSQGVLYGTTILINKKYYINFTINIFMVIFNIILSYYLYLTIGIYGVAMASAISLAIRYLFFKYYFWKYG